MPAGSDSGSVRTHEEEHLRRFVAARAGGDRAQMRRWWDELVIDVFDRMDGFVGAAHKGRLDDDEHQLAVQLAMIRFSKNLAETYAGSSMGELVNATRTLARGICMDVQRRSITRREHEALTVDEHWDADPEDAVRRGSPAEGDAARRRFEDAERQDEREAFLAWALPQLGDNRRRVLELTLDGVPLDEIASALDVSHDNAYQLRSRGLKDLKKLKERYDA
jgi:RNA polymerase sigma factor (sigma-70 family)